MLWTLCLAPTRRPLWHHLALAISFVLLLQATAAYTSPLLRPQGSSFAQVRVETESCSSHAMDTLETPFTIEINGKPISKVTTAADEPVPAKVGPAAAIFTLKDGRLQSDGHVLGRNVTENRSMLPKTVYWFKKSVEKDRVRPVTARQEGDIYKLDFAGASLKEVEGDVLADILNEGESTVAVKML